MIVPGVVSHPDQMLSPFFLYYTRMLHEVPFSHICFKCAETLHEG